jgi:hypothetical protein
MDVWEVPGSSRSDLDRWLLMDAGPKSATEIGLPTRVDVTVPESACQAKSELPRGHYVSVAPGVVGSVFSRRPGQRRRRRFGSCPPGSVVVATGSCNRSCLARLLPTHSFARDRPRDPRAAPPGQARQTRTYLVRIPRRPSHSIQRVVQAGPNPEGSEPPHPRSHPSWPGREGSRGAGGSSDRTTGPTFRWSARLRQRPIEPRAALRPPPAPGTRRTSSAGSACAR